MMISALHNVDYDLFAEDPDEDGLRNCQGCDNPYPPAQMPRHQEVCADYMAWVNETQAQANASHGAMAIAPFRPVWQLPKAKNKASGSKSASTKDVKPRIEVKPEPRSPIERPRSRKTDLKGKGRATFSTPPPEISQDDEWLYKPIVLIDDSSDEDDDIQATEAPLPPRINTPVQARPKSGIDLHGDTVEALTLASVHPKLGRRWLAIQLALIKTPPDAVPPPLLEPEQTPTQSVESDQFARDEFAREIFNLGNEQFFDEPEEEPNMAPSAANLGNLPEGRQPLTGDDHDNNARSPTDAVSFDLDALLNGPQGESRLESPFRHPLNGLTRNYSARP